MMDDLDLMEEPDTIRPKSITPIEFALYQQRFVSEQFGVGAYIQSGKEDVPS